jgi:hypothetical protein
MPTPPLQSDFSSIPLVTLAKGHRRSNEPGNSSGESSSGKSTAMATPPERPQLVRRPKATLQLPPLPSPPRPDPSPTILRVISAADEVAEVRAQRAEHRRRNPNMVLFNTRYKPFYVIGIGAMGNWLYGTGTLAIERGVFPRRPVAPVDSPLDALPGKFQPLFGSKSASVGIGAASTGGGLLLALGSCALGYMDSRKLARKQNSASPNYTRANVYAGVHVGAILLSVGAKFMGDAIRDTVARDYTWAAAVPGWIGQACFAVTQAQAFSNCELQNGKMPLKRRGAIGFAGRATMGLFSLHGVMQGVPYLNPYGKEIVRLAAVTASTFAYSLPLTTARISRQAALDPRPNDGPPPMSWRALYILSVYLAGRAFAGFGPDLVQRGVVDGRTVESEVDVVKNVFGGSLMLAFGTGLAVAAMMLFRDDVRRYDPRRGDWLLGLGFAALMFIEVYRLLLEYGLNADLRQLVWVAVVPGVVGTGLRFAVLPELFCYSELYNGDLPLKNRYQWTEASRAAAQLGFGVWGAMCAVPGFNPFVREAVGITSGALATLGMALPTTTSRRTLPQFAWPLSPGATPQHERSDPFGDG